jgi:hypothetical protein
MCSFLTSEWERQNNMRALKLSKIDLLELQIQVVEVSFLQYLVLLSLMKRGCVNFLFPFVFN